MRHVLAGALGAAMVYPALWYGLAPEGPVTTPAGAPQRALATTAGPSVRREQVHPGEPQRPGPASSPAALSSQSSHELDSELPPVRERPTLQELPAALGASGEPARPALRSVSEPEAPSVAFSDVREALGRMSDLQAHAHDPDELARRVQSMEQDPQQLARLKALAEMFVQLPPSRLEPYMPGREGGSTGSR